MDCLSHNQQIMWWKLHTWHKLLCHFKPWRAAFTSDCLQSPNRGVPKSGKNLHMSFRCLCPSVSQGHVFRWINTLNVPLIDTNVAAFLSVHFEHGEQKRKRRYFSLNSPTKNYPLTKLNLLHTESFELKYNVRCKRTIHWSTSKQSRIDIHY